MSIEPRLVRATAIVALPVAGDGDEPRGPAEGSGPQSACDVVAVEPGKAQVDQHNLGLLGQSDRYTARSISRFADLMPLRLEEQPERLSRIVAVLDDQNA